MKYSRDLSKRTKEQEGPMGRGKVEAGEKRKGMVKKVVSTPPPGAAPRDLTAEAPRPCTTLSCGAAGGTQEAHRLSGIMTTAAATLCAPLGRKRKLRYSRALVYPSLSSGELPAAAATTG